MAELTEGQKWIQTLEDEGYSDENITGMREQRTRSWLDAGGDQKSIDEYWGNVPKPPNQTMEKIAANNLRSSGLDASTLDTADPESWWEVIKAGFGNSTTGLSYRKEFGIGPIRKQLPPPEQMGWFNSFLAGTAQFVGDFPVAYPAALATTYAAGPVAGAYAFGAAPEAYRLSLIDDDELTTFEVITAVNNAGLANVAGAKAGQVAGKVLEGVVGKGTKTAAEIGANALAGTAAMGALNGQMPTKEDFVASLLMAGMFPVGVGTGKQVLYHVKGARDRIELTASGKSLMDRVKAIYAKTGIDPITQARAAAADPAARQAMAGTNSDGQPNVEAWEGYKPPPPPPPKPSVNADEPVIIGAAKGSDEPLPQFKKEGKVNPDDGFAFVKSASVDQVEALINHIDKEAGAAKNKGHRRREKIDAIINRNKNEDGTYDLAAILIDHHAGEGQAQFYRANGRQHEKLPPDTQRYIETLGTLLEKQGYAPEPLDAAGDGGSGGPPKTPPRPALEGPAPPPRPFGEMADIVNKDVVTSKVERSAADLWRRLKYSWRELAPAEEFDRVFNTTKGDKDLGVEDWMRMGYAAPGHTMTRVMVGGIDVGIDKAGTAYFKVDPKVPSYNSIIKRATKLEGGIEHWRAFMQARDTLDRAKLGLKTTTKKEDAEELLRSVPKGLKHLYDELAHDYQKMKVDVLKGLQQSGRLNLKQIEKYLTDHPNHFPQKVAKNKATAGIGQKVSKVIYNAKGHEYGLEDQLLSTIIDMDRASTFNMVNFARRRAVELLQKQFGGSGKMRDGRVLTGPDDRAKTGKELATTETAYKHGVILDDAGMLKLDDEKFFNPATDEIHYWEDGVAKTYRVPEFDGKDIFMEMLTSPRQFNQDVARGVLVAAGRFKRGGIVYNPVFIAKALIKDAVTAPILSKWGGVPVLNAMQGAAEVIQHVIGGKIGKTLTNQVNEFNLNGGFLASVLDMDANHVMEIARNSAATGFGGSFHNSVATVFDMGRQFIRHTDSMVRIGGVFKHGRDELGTMRAALRSRTTTGDFKEAGGSAGLNFMSSVTPFFRAKMRTMIDANLRAWKEDKGHVLKASGMYVAIPSIMALSYAYFMQDLFSDEIPEAERLENRPHNARDTMWHIPIPGPNGIFTLTVPVPFENGIIIHGPLDRMFAKWKTGNPREFKNFVHDFMSRVLGGGVQNPDNAVPNLLGPVRDLLTGNPVFQSAYEMASSQDVYTSRDWIPDRLKGLAPNDQVLPWTTETAKTTAGLINSVGGDLSPITFEKYLRTWTGTVGPGILQSLDYAGQKTGLQNNEDPADFANTPFFGSFVARNPGINTQPLNDFYDEYKEYQKVHKQLRKASNDMNVSREIELSFSPYEQSGFPDAVLTLSAMRKSAYAIMENKDLSADDKRQQIDMISSQMIQTAAMAMSLLDGMKDHGAQTP